MKHVVYIGTDEWLVTHSDGRQIADYTHHFCNIDGNTIAGNDARIAQRYWPERSISNPIKLQWHSLKPSHPYAAQNRQLGYALLRCVLDQANCGGEIDCFLPSLVVKKLAARFPDIVFHDLFLSYCNIVGELANHSRHHSLLVHIHASTLDIGVIDCQAGSHISLNTYLTHAFESESELSTHIQLLPSLLSDITPSQITDVYIAGRSPQCLVTLLQGCGYATHQVGLHQVVAKSLEPRSQCISTPPSPQKFAELIRKRFNISLGQLMAQIKHTLTNKEATAPVEELHKLQYLITTLIRNAQAVPVESIAETLYFLSKVLEQDYSCIHALKRCLLRSSVGARTTLRMVTLISKFSWGKSTLLNALLGDTILSADLRAETKRVTKILQGHGYAEIIEYRDEIRVIDHPSPEQLSERVKMLTSVRGDEHGEIIDYYVVVPEVTGWEDTLLVDTPGYSSRFEEHDRLADSAWPESDIIIAIYDPSQVGEATFTEKVRQILESGKQILFVITKGDQIEGRESVLRTELSAALSHEVRVIFISGYHALFGRKWLNGSYTLDDIQQELDLFVNEEGIRITGARLRQDHAPLMLAASNIGQLEQTLWTMLGEPI